jgi:hypothetical protein
MEAFFFVLRRGTFSRPYTHMQAFVFAFFLLLSAHRGARSRGRSPRCASTAALSVGYRGCVCVCVCVSCTTQLARRRQQAPPPHTHTHTNTAPPTNLQTHHNPPPAPTPTPITHLDRRLERLAFLPLPAGLGRTREVLRARLCHQRRILRGPFPALEPRAALGMDWLVHSFIDQRGLGREKGRK